MQKPIVDLVFNCVQDCGQVKGPKGSKPDPHVSESRDVIDHVTTGFPIGHFLLVVLRNQTSIRVSIQFPRYSMANVTQWLT